MKNLIYWSFAAIAFSIALGCTTENNQEGEIQALQNRIQEIERENERLRDLNKDNEQGLVSEEPTSSYNDTFLENFCQLLTDDDLKTTLAPQLEVPNHVSYYERLINQIKGDITDCEYEKKPLYDHPFDIAEYKTNVGYLYVQAHYSPDFKIRRFQPLSFEFQLEMEFHQVPTQDGEKLATWLIYRKDGAAKKGMIFLRTPYMVYGSVIGYSYLSSYFDKVLVLQANRGTHTSTGPFQWLHPVNIQDSRDSLDWMIQHPRSNGKVLAYGVSYDGYDALATAATNHPALKSVIACSAPANAATDSFTSSQFVENGLFSYVLTDLSNETTDDSQSYREFIKTDVSHMIRGRMDDVLLGLDEEEWNITSAAIDDKNHEYWQERQLLDQLVETKMPIAHVAGLVRDQDGRDTLLAFNHIKNNSPYADQSFLVLHQWGHGCGDDFWARVPIARKLIAMTDNDAEVDLESEKQYAHYIKHLGDYQFTDNPETLPLDKVSMPIDETLNLQDYSAMGIKDPNLYSQTLVYQISEKMILNGAPQVKLALKANLPEVPVHIHYQFIDPMGQVNREAFGWRTGVITSKTTTVEEVTLTFPLVNSEIPAGSQLMVEISTFNDWVFLRNPRSRQNAFLFPGMQPGVQVLSNESYKSELILPVERTPEMIAAEEAAALAEQAEDGADAVAEAEEGLARNDSEIEALDVTVGSQSDEEVNTEAPDRLADVDSPF